ncbi:MAG: hypothetical protein ABI885_20960 [Gammaproteobacteria bacterium]
MKTPVFQAARVAAVLVLGLSAVALSGCGHMPRMPWSPKPVVAPTPVNELTETTLDGSAAAYPQYWKRNTLVVDLQSAPSSGGSVVLKPQPDGKWPVRIAFRVMPGQLSLIEVQADQRLLMPVTRDGAKAIDLELVPGVYTPKTQAITVKWESSPAPAS